MRLTLFAVVPDCVAMGYHLGSSSHLHLKMLGMTSETPPATTTTVMIHSSSLVLRDLVVSLNFLSDGIRNRRSLKTALLQPYIDL